MPIDKLAAPAAADPVPLPPARGSREDSGFADLLRDAQDTHAAQDDARAERPRRRERHEDVDRPPPAGDRAGATPEEHAARRAHRHDRRGNDRESAAASDGPAAPAAGPHPTPTRVATAENPGTKAGAVPAATGPSAPVQPTPLTEPSAGPATPPPSGATASAPSATSDLDFAGILATDDAVPPLAAGTSSDGGKSDVAAVDPTAQIAAIEIHDAPSAAAAPATQPSIPTAVPVTALAVAAPPDADAAADTAAAGGVPSLDRPAAQSPTPATPGSGAAPDGAVAPAGTGGENGSPTDGDGDGEAQHDGAVAGDQPADAKSAAAADGESDAGDNDGNAASRPSPDRAAAASAPDASRDAAPAPSGDAAGKAADASTTQQGAGPQLQPAPHHSASPAPAHGFAHELRAHTAAQPPADAAPRMPLPPAEQVAVEIGRAVRDGQDSFSLELRPGDLGRISVDLQVGDDRRVTAVVHVDRPDTLQLLQRDAQALERALHQAGLRAEGGSLSFNLRSDGGAQQNPFSGGGGHGRAITLRVPAAAAEAAAHLTRAWRLDASGIDIRV